MKERRWLQNKKLREAAMAEGLAVGSEIVIRERSILKDGGYITRQIRKGRVLILYPYHFYCEMADGTKECFRYNELLGDEARLIRIKGKHITENKKAPERVLFFTRTVGFEPTRRLPDLSDFESELFNHLSTSPYN